MGRLTTIFGLTLCMTFILTLTGLTDTATAREETTAASTSDGSTQRGWSSWRRFKSVYNQRGHELIRLEWRTYQSKGSSYAKAQWRVYNMSNATLYSISLDRRTYQLSNGSSDAASGSYITSRLGPGDRAGLTPDSLGSARGESVMSVNFPSGYSAVELQLERSGPKVGWGELGSIR